MKQFIALTCPETGKAILIDIQHIIAIKPSRVASGGIRTTIELELGTIECAEHPDVIFARFRDMSAHGVTILIK